MEGVWTPVSPYIYADKQRRICNERAAGLQCGRVFVKIPDRDFRWRHQCGGLLYGVETAYTAEIHGRWFMSLSLEALDRLADAMRAPAQAEAAGPQLAEVIDLDSVRRVA